MSSRTTDTDRRRLSRRHQAVERIAQQRHDGRRDAQRAQIDRLEFDGVLAGVRELALEQIVPIELAEPLEERTVGGNSAKRSVVRLAGGREVAVDRRVARAEDDVQLCWLRLGKRPVGPAVRRCAAVQVDVRGNHRPECRRVSVGGKRCRRRAWSIAVAIAGIEHAPQIVEAGRIRAGHCRPQPLGQEGGLARWRRCSKRGPSR